MRMFSRHLLGVLGLAAALSMATGAGAFAADNDLMVFDWAGYDTQDYYPSYMAKHKEPPTFTFFGDEDEAFEKIRSGFKADLGHPCAQSVKKWREAGLLQPLDTSKIPGWKDISPGIAGMKDLMTTADGKAWFLPRDWGNTALTYNPDKVDAKDIQSLKAFADPKFQGHVSIGDNVDDAYALAALAIGMHDWTQMSDEQFKQASDFLRQVHKNVVLYWSDPTALIQAMSGGEVTLAWAWNDTATQLAKAGTRAERNVNTDEGATTWVCGYVRFKDAPGSEDKAYDFINAMNDPDNASYMVKEWGYGVSNAKGMASVDPKLLKDKGYAPEDQKPEKMLFQSPLPNELKQKMIAEFEKIKAGY
ncbi:extracellular solute-binding protein [Labrys okinawensis]|uniref:extracellular solute-binding protein n=1 Tax=Labrys okinawensis TaxID=346911 RepID=UPI0039BCD740